MTQEDKQLLLKDLCTRLPYRVIAYASEINKNGIITDVNVPYNMVNLTVDNDSGKYELVPLFDVKPYLRSMSSMTEEERDELYTAMDWYGEIDETGNVYTKGQEKVYRETFYEYTDWLNAHHFDFRGLIEKGLALEAPEDMYKEK